MGIFRIGAWKRTHKIEFFGVSVGIALFGLVATSGSILMHARSVQKDVLTNQAIYVKEFTTSLSDVRGEIVQVYADEGRTRCGILVRFENPQLLSADAKDYQVFVKGFNVSRGQYADETLASPSGGFCIFGSTGYALIYLVESSGFQAQALECIVRSNETLHVASQTSSEAADLQAKDGSYAQYDQFRIVVNPNASGAVTVGFLEDLDATALYKMAIVDQSEGEIREKLAQDVDQMNTAMKSILSYQENLKNLQVRVPALPPEIAGDQFTAEDLMDGSQMLVYRPGSVLPKGVNIDWFHKDLSDADASGTVFLTKELLGQRGEAQFFGDLSAAQEKRSDALSNLTSGSWVMADGTQITVDNDSPMADIKAMSQNITDYVNAVNSYYSMKYEYQCRDLVSYLQLEYNMKNTGNTISGNFADGVITAW